MTKLMMVLALASATLAPITAARADGNPPTNTKPSDLNLQSSDGVGKLWILQTWNSGG